MPGETSSYANLREVLAPRLREAPTEELEALFAAAGVSAEELDEFLSTIANFGRQVAQGVQRFVPQVQQFVQSPQFQAGLAGAGQGAALGSTILPGWGTAIGAGAGLLGSLLGGQPRPPAAAPGAPAGIPPPGMAPTGMPPPAPPGPVQPPPGAGSPAAAQLLGLLSQPQVLQALMGMMLGPAGARTVPVSGVPVPVAQVASTMGMLANQAQAEHELALALADDADAGFVGDGGAKDPAEGTRRLLELVARESETALAPPRPRRLAAEAEQPEQARSAALEWLPAVEYDPVYPGA